MEDTYTQEVREVEGRLSLALEDTYLKHASLLVQGHSTAENNLQTQLGDACRLADTLRKRAENLRKRNDSLRKKVERGQNTTARAADKAVRAYAAEQEDSVALDLKTKGVITGPVRDLIRDLVALGLKVSQIKGTISAVAQTAGTPVKGSISEHSVGRIVLEGGVYAKLQIAEDIVNASSLTASSDGTTHRSINLDSCHLHTHHATSHERRFLGIHSAANHTSESQLRGWQACITDVFDTYNASPLGREKPADVRTLVVKTEGILTDHAEDQKKLARLFKQWKSTCDRELRGEQVLAEMSSNDVLQHLAEEIAYLVSAHPSPEGEAAEESDVQAAQVRRAVALKLGEAEYALLPDEDKARVDRFVHAGCCMHKELNSVKGGNTEMVAYWATAGVQGPVLLMNKGNGAAASHGPSPAQQHATAVSRGGAVKAAELAGHLFRHKDDKKGQQNIFRYHFEASYCGASAELLVHLPLYRRFLEQIRDKKISGQLAHLEQNVQKALDDVPTLTEFCALALYAQAISHPYMREVRGAHNPNHLDLGPLHERVVAHCERIIRDPSILLAPDVTPARGALDSQGWERPEVLIAIQDLAPELPHLEGVLVAFFKGALKTWRRFSVEYTSGGAIATLTASERERAWMPATNDENEGALGSYRQTAKQAPNMSIHQYNARTMYSRNGTATYIHQQRTAATDQFTRKEARRMDSGGLERKRRQELAEEDMHTAAKRRKQRDSRAKKKSARKAQLKDVKQRLIRDVAALTLEKTNVKMLDEQLDCHREFYDSKAKAEKKIPIKKLLKTKAQKLEALIAAVERYNENPPVSDQSDEDYTEDDNDEGEGNGRSDSEGE
ncbi:hypothetical protein C2E23DRAFT_739684 [Lenzites betulinus]|nr:hypothetical protein C2E23DRAFT_739684 [Lenzites betulinus]